MKILIADFDLFSQMGGGQTFYRRVIANHPNDQYYYLNDQETSDTNRPQNVTAIAYQQPFIIADFNRYFDVTPPKWIYRSFVIASNIAASVAGQTFDIIEVPDYQQWGVFLRPALEYHKVKFDKVVLSLHGKISTTIFLDWFSHGEANIPLDLEEKMQYKTVDLRYAISKIYIDEWKELVGIEASYYNPLHFLELPEPQNFITSDTPPDLNFIGRTERRKGPDLFVDLAWWLPRSSYHQGSIIGPNSFDDSGNASSVRHLQTIINHRVKDIQLLPAKSREGLKEVFATKSITVVPSRYDTLNLVALESLFSGCPTAIGDGAGVCRFLAETFPKIPFIKVDTQNIRHTLPDLMEVLTNYESYRQQLNEALVNSPIDLQDPPLSDIYQTSPQFDQDTREELSRWYQQLMTYWQQNQASGLAIKSKVNRLLRFKVQPQYVKLKQQTKQTITQKVEDATTGQLLRSPFLYKQYRGIFNAAENTPKDIQEKLEACWNLCQTLEPDKKGIRAKLKSGYRIDRGRLWRQIARLEQLRGNDVVAATYYLRGMRLLGSDRFGELPFVLKTLQEKGFSQEATVIEAMYGNPSQEVKNCLELIEKSYHNHQSNPEKDYEIFDDQRDKSEYKVSVIVSLYNAHEKLPLFLKTLKNQTLMQQGVGEIILVDSGSPGDEYKVFQQLAPQLNLPILYVRSKERETIQSAWNRGINLAHSPYLSFLGVDETIVSDCLEVLATELDKDPSLDWVIGNSLVTNVDPKGQWLNDIMLYDRRNYDQDLVYLETCYLSWVGALYRRSIHERFGYYDATFRAAGDTEFKNRLLPHIKTKAVDRTLGLFWNYPDERTTQSPLAEIEDMRAWYLHRTLAGVKYAFNERSVEELEKMLYYTLCYRKSYCQHWSTDLDYAYNVCLLLQEKSPTSPALRYFDGIKSLLSAYRSLDWVETPSFSAPINTLNQTRKMGRQIEQEHRSTWQPDYSFGGQPVYDIFHDNRHEQHSFLWFT
ncbi:MAG: glycosyltransferase [Microcystaceae cyanobacterium]